jgi:hypothetical protein
MSKRTLCPVGFVWIALMAVAALMPLTAFAAETPALAASAEEPIALRVVNTSLLQAFGSFEVDSFHRPFEPVSHAMREELVESVRTALKAETALPKASPAQGWVEITCLDDAAACKTVQATVKAGNHQGPVVWQQEFDNTDHRSPWQWFVFTGWKKPAQVAAEIVQALKADYTATPSASAIDNTEPAE